MLDKKDFTSLTQKAVPKTMEEIEANIWKDNIKQGSREHKDFLDTTNEDFRNNKSKGVDGQEITPSSFNIFKDSLRAHSEKLLETLNENLPDLNLQEIEESESDRDGTGTEDEDVLPLDFRTALIEKDNRVVIQAKPLQFKTDAEALKDEETKKSGNPSNLDDYLEKVRQESFKEDEGAILLDPDINIKEKFDQIDLPCNQEDRINNTLNAPKRPEQILPTSSHSGKKKVPKGPVSHKTYDTDTDGNEEMAQIDSTSKPKSQSRSTGGKNLE